MCGIKAEMRMNLKIKYLKCSTKIGKGLNFINLLNLL